ncbi:hypothetical protein [Kribbella sp. NPDC048915]|uniref:hypothetical protein n=1 Tax=Kribbella sp. NPDC048915 TaxID=3155148 RepID=UPI003409B10A
MATRPREGGRAGRTVLARTVAVVAAAWWVLLFFGLIDLLVGIMPAEFPSSFRPFIVLETSWGLLYTVLIPLPLIVWAVRPAGWVGPQIAAVAAALLVTGVAAVAAGQILVAFLVAASAAFPRMWRTRKGWSIHAVRTTPALWPVAALVVLGFGVALVHAWDVLALARAGVDDDDTWGLKHLPMQAGFALAVPASAAVAVLAMANRMPTWWFAIVPSTASAIWFGITCARHPDLLGSLGTAPGRLAVAWATAIAVAIWITGHRSTATTSA